MSRRDRARDRAPRRWPWGRILLAAVALAAGFRWTNELFYPGPRRPPGETLKFADPKPPDGPPGDGDTGGVAGEGTRERDLPDADESAGLDRGTGTARVAPPPSSGGEGGDAVLPVSTPRVSATPRQPAVPSVSPAPAIAPGVVAPATAAPRPTSGAPVRASRPRPRPKESFDDIDRRTLDAILERRERERKAQQRGSR